MSGSMDRRDFMKGAFASGAVATGAGLGILGGAVSANAAPVKAAKRATVPRSTLGSTGEDIPAMLFGCGRPFDPQYDKRLHYAYKHGIEYFDHAQGYGQGQSHKTFVPFMEQIGGREKLWLTSKVHLDGSDATPANYKANLDLVLQDLQTDYLDMFFMHMVRDLDRLDAPFIKMAEDLKKSGKIKYFGFSCHHGNVPELIEKAAKVGGIDAIMFRYNFRQYGDYKLNTAIDNAKKAGIGLIAMKTQASVPEDQEKVVEFKSKNFTLPQAKLKAVWADERLDAAISGMYNYEQCVENIDAALTPAELSMNEFHQLNRLAALTAPYACNGCSHICESRVAGDLRVADQLRYLMYADSYGDVDEAKRLYNNLRPEERDFEHADLGDATAACPQGIRIAERLADAKRMLTA